MIKWTFIDGEGYQIKYDKDELINNCFYCGREIDDDEVFYICENKKTSFCFDCRLKAPCQRPNRSIIPSQQSLRPGCVHRKILNKSKLVKKL